ncbi:hypothetical protein [Chamaesiphon sp. VAR_69_metabat_338]|uniref:hypothetical protein n=1 Tax=Chamaesiphon sp. VAR_69_metabat_338 TaxID=2964704 RepID=UPI00286D8E9D|nr:hypothetical protein [Chamaesiphon sp. VAR_69_metabat_338]
MNNELVTAKLWNELDESQTENLNGGGGYGYGYSPNLNISIAGGVGSLQQNAGDGYQFNVYPVGKASKPYYY